MEKLSELNLKLANEKKKPKHARNNALMTDLQEQIWQNKAILKKGYKNRQKEKHEDEVKFNLSLWKKKNDRYGKIREAKKNERLENERKQAEKIQQKKKSK